jgi:hypothetical protein
LNAEANLQFLWQRQRCEKLLLEAAMSVLAPKPVQRADANPSIERGLDSEEAAGLLKTHSKTLMTRSGRASFSSLTPQTTHANLQPVAQATVSPIFDNNRIEILTAEELAARLKVKVSWIVDHCSRAKTRDPLPVLRVGKHRRFRWNGREMNDWLDRHAGVSR